MDVATGLMDYVLKADKTGDGAARRAISPMMLHVTVMPWESASFAKLTSRFLWRDHLQAYRLQGVQVSIGVDPLHVSHALLACLL